MVRFIRSTFARAKKPSWPISRKRLIFVDTFRAGPEIDAGQLDQVREAATRLIESQQNQLDNQFVNLAFVPDSK